MAKYLKKFETHAQYETYLTGDTMARPNVSLCEDNRDVHYNQIIPPFFCKLTLNDDSVVNIEGEGALTSAMTSAYSLTCVSVEIGELCYSIGESAFDYFSYLRTITIPNSVTSIGDYTFCYCSGLTSVTIGSGVTSIGEYAFYYCHNLTSITVPNSVRSIDEGAFHGCTGLTSVTIGSNIMYIGSIVFGNCSRIESITSLAATAPTVINDTFKYVKTGGTLYVPIGSSGYNTWMQNANYYLGKYGWTKVEQ